MEFPPKRRPLPSPRKENDDTCRMKIKRDPQGRPKEIEVSGKCSKEKVELARHQLGLDEKE